MSIGVKKRKCKAAQMENKTLPNFKLARSLIQKYMVIFTNTIGEAETRILDTLYMI